MLLQSNAAIVLCVHNAAVSPSEGKTGQEAIARDPTQVVVGTGVPPPSKGQESVRSGRAGVDAERQIGCTGKA
jgi:hypothetical protein